MIEHTPEMYIGEAIRRLAIKYGIDVTKKPVKRPKSVAKRIDYFSNEGKIHRLYCKRHRAYKTASNATERKFAYQETREKIQKIRNEEAKPRIRY